MPVECVKKAGKSRSLRRPSKHKGIELQFSHALQGDATILARGLSNLNANWLWAGRRWAINEIVCGMAGSHLPLMIFPAGTANVLAMRSACRKI
jgi:hypothetical protein